MNFKLYANCIPVKGAKRSTICDLQKKEIFFIPNELFEILSINNKSIDEVKLRFQNQYDDIIDEYFDYLVKNDLGFYTETPELFPKLSMKWNYPFEISNAIIDRDTSSTYDIYSILKQLDYLNCKHIQIRFYESTSKSYISNILTFLNKLNSIIISVDFIIPDSIEFNQVALHDLLNEDPRINSFSIFNSDCDKVVPPVRHKSGFIIYSKAKINRTSCGIINPQYFIVNMKSFTESVSKNSCLNGKISIDVNGDIKNCPSMTTSYGNVRDKKLSEILIIKDFKQKWEITKDQIKVCKDCEFRHVCSDCRAYTENPYDNYSKPLKCGYDPYTNEWKNWSINPLKQKAIKYYGMQELTKDKD